MPIHKCIRDPAHPVGARGDREQAGRAVRAMDDENIRSVLKGHRDRVWLEERKLPEFHGNGKAMHPNLRRFMRLVKQEAHRRGITHTTRRTP